MKRDQEPAGNLQKLPPDQEKAIEDELPKAVRIILRSSPKQLRQGRGTENLRATKAYLQHFLTIVNPATPMFEEIKRRIEVKVTELDDELAPRSEEDKKKKRQREMEIEEKNKAERLKLQEEERKRKEEAKKAYEVAKIEARVVKESSRTGNTSDQVERARLGKVKALFEVADRVKIDDLASLLKMPRGDLIERLIAWSKDISFKISGDEIVVAGDASDKLLSELDRHFASWNEKGARKDGRI